MFQSRFLGRGCDEALFREKRRLLSEKGGGNSVNERFGKGFYRGGNSVKRSGPFSEAPDSENWKVAVLIPFPKIGSECLGVSDTVGTTLILIEVFGPEKDYLAPPPPLLADMLVAPVPPPPLLLLRYPPAPSIFRKKKKRPPATCSDVSFLFPGPESK